MRTLPHPLEEALLSRAQLLATTLSPSTAESYRYTVRLFMSYLRLNYPEIRRASELKRDPHMLGWLEHLWMQKVRFTNQPLRAGSRGVHILRLRRLFDLMTDHRFPPRPGLLWSQDIPRRQDNLPRPLTAEDDIALKNELRRRNDPLSNALLLTRLTGMRPGETVDLAVDCLHHSGDGHWLLHIPPVKVRKERWVPIDEEARDIVARLAYLRTLPPPVSGPSRFLLPRPDSREALGDHLRIALHEAATHAGMTTHIVPYQLRHTFATTMLREGVSLPALMKLLGHRTAGMTLQYLQITQQDLQHEFDLVRLNPRHLAPVPKQVATTETDAADAPAVIHRLSAAIRVLELYRQQNAAIGDKPIQLLFRRLVRIRSRFQNLVSSDGKEK